MTYTRMNFTWWNEKEENVRLQPKYILTLTHAQAHVHTHIQDQLITIKIIEKYDFGNEQTKGLLGRNKVQR